MAQTRDQLDTPCLVVNREALDRNLATLAGFFRQRNVAWRPHAKSYKSSQLGRRVVAAGAIGLTCATLDEAEVFGAAGIPDLLITGPVVGSSKQRRLAELRHSANPIAVVDHPDHVVGLAAAASQSGVRLRTLIEIDLGMKRCGVAPGECAVQLARQIVACPALELVGIMGWEGHLLTIVDPDEKRAKIEAALGQLALTRQQLLAAGLPCPIVSAGGSGSFQITAELGIATEIQAGGAIFMDQFYRQRCHVTGLENALTLLGTIISRPAADRAVMDVGRKATNPETFLPQVIGRDDLKVAWMSAEHGVLEVLHGPGPRIGERIELIPGYGDLTTLLHDCYYVLHGDSLEATWPLDAR